MQVKYVLNPFASDSAHRLRARLLARFAAYWLAAVQCLAAVVRGDWPAGRVSTLALASSATESASNCMPIACSTIDTGPKSAAAHRRPTQPYHGKSRP